MPLANENQADLISEETERKISKRWQDSSFENNINIKSGKKKPLGKTVMFWDIFEK